MHSRRRWGRRRALLTGGAGGLAALLAACGSGAPASRRRATSTPAAIVADLPPRPGGVLRVRGAGMPPLDPHANVTYLAQQQAGAVYSRLLRFVTAADPVVSANYQIAPDLAEAWEIGDDGLRVVFRLNAAARWHPVAPVNGRSVEAEDVKASLVRFRSEPRNTNRAVFGSAELKIIDKVEIPDARTVVVKLQRPFGPLLNLFANAQYLWIMPREAGAGFDPARTQIGSGPFLFEPTQTDDLVRVRRNPAWFVSGRPYVDAVERLIMKGEAQERAQFAAERLDVAAVSPDARAGFARQSPKARLLAYVPPTYTYLSPQLRGVSPYRDERVRHALSLALDRQGWLALMYPGATGRSLSFVPASMGRWWLDPLGAAMGEASRWFRHEPKEARALLRAAGVEGLALRFVYPYDAYGAKFNQGMDATIGMLRDAGFQVTAAPQDYLRDFIAPGGTITGSYEGVFYALQSSFSDPHDYLFAMNHTASRRNSAGVNDAEVDYLIEAQARTLDEEERVKRVHDVQRYLAERMYYIPMAVGETFVALQPWVRNYHHTLGNGIATETYAELWLDR